MDYFLFIILFILTNTYYTITKITKNAHNNKNPGQLVSIFLLHCGI